jgi:hypothetical protein
MVFVLLALRLVERQIGRWRGLCQAHMTESGRKQDKGAGMKVNVEVECTPEEARRFLGLPDVTRANDVYVDAIAKAMQGMNSVDQLQGFAKQIAPMGEMGLKLFQQFVEQGAGAAMAGFKAGADKPKP